MYIIKYFSNYDFADFYTRSLLCLPLCSSPLQKRAALHAIMHEILNEYDWRMACGVFVVAYGFTHSHNNNYHACNGC